MGGVRLCPECVQRFWGPAGDGERASWTAEPLGCRVTHESKAGCRSPQGDLGVCVAASHGAPGWWMGTPWCGCEWLASLLVLVSECGGGGEGGGGADPVNRAVPTRCNVHSSAVWTAMCFPLNHPWRGWRPQQSVPCYLTLFKGTIEARSVNTIRQSPHGSAHQTTTHDCHGPRQR